MFGGVEMFGGVSVFGGITAADVAAGHAQAQMHPLIAHLQAFFAAFGVRVNILLDLIEMGALGHRSDHSPRDRNSGVPTNTEAGRSYSMMATWLVPAEPRPV